MNKKMELPNWAVLLGVGLIVVCLADGQKAKRENIDLERRYRSVNKERKNLSNMLDELQ